MPGGRPRLGPLALSEVITVRLKPHEAEMLDRLRKGMTRSAYIRLLFIEMELDKRDKSAAENRVSVTPSKPVQKKEAEDAPVERSSPGPRTPDRPAVRAKPRHPHYWDSALSSAGCTGCGVTRDEGRGTECPTPQDLLMRRG